MLGHVARMNEDRIPKRMLFGWLPQQRPAHGTKMRWRARVRKDLKKFGIEEGSWYKVAQEREVEGEDVVLGWKMAQRGECKRMS